MLQNENQGFYDVHTNVKLGFRTRSPELPFGGVLLDGECPLDCECPFGCDDSVDRHS